VFKHLGGQFKRRETRRRRCRRRSEKNTERFYINSASLKGAVKAAP